MTGLVAIDPSPSSARSEFQPDKSFGVTDHPPSHEQTLLYLSLQLLNQASKKLCNFQNLQHQPWSVS
jgi:hypothetical protein